jgi:hypothetical protein
MGKYSEEFKNLVEEIVKEGYNITYASQMACVRLDIPYTDKVRRAMSSHLERTEVTDNKELPESDMFLEAQKRELDKTKQRFIVSWCQSDTEIHEQFMDNIEAYAKEIDAEISIIAGRYKNPTSLNSSKRVKEKEERNSWSPRIEKYLDANRHKVHKHLCILSDLKIQPTASTPLSGINGLTGLESCVVGHPRVHLKSLPILDGYPHKLLVTTGAISLQNYTDTKSGKKGEFHHTLGFVIIELDEDDFHIRQVTADDDGSFYDLHYNVTRGSIRETSKTVMVFGDLHLGETNNDVLDVSFRMAEDLNCEDIILHDVFNGHSISHHERNQPFQLMSREDDGSGDLMVELNNMAAFFDRYSDFNFVMVRSNHDEFLDRWLNDVDWRKSTNKSTYLELAHVLKNDTIGKGIIPAILNKYQVTNVKCLGINDSFRVENIECGVHGHIGANGSRGGVIQFKNLNTKNITGHTHSPCREDGHSSVGTLTHLRVGYNKGASSWMNTNVVIYPNGKSQHVHIVNNKYTTL